MWIRADETSFTIVLKDKKEILLKYPEATIWESLDFLEVVNKKDFSLIEYIYNFILQFWDKQITKQEFQDNITLEFWEFMQQIKTSRFSGIFEEKKENPEKIEENPEDNEKKGFDLDDIEKDLAKILTYLSPKMARDPKYIMQNYSWSELTYWAKWYVYQDNEQTKEWRERNRALENNDHIDKNKDFYEKEFEKLDLYLKKQQLWKKN